MKKIVCRSRLPKARAMIQARRLLARPLYLFPAGLLWLVLVAGSSPAAAQTLTTSVTTTTTLSTAPTTSTTSSTATATATKKVAPPAPATYRADRIIVKPKAGTPATQLDILHSSLGTRKLRKFSKLGNLQIVQLPATSDVTTMLAQYKNSGLVEYAEPDYIVHVLMEPNDFRYQDGSLWHLCNVGIYGGTPGADISAPAGWDIQNTATNIIVAVIDTGVRCTHEDLADNLWTNPGETGNDLLGHDKGTNGVDDDLDGFTDDVHGINAILGTGDPSDDHGHGTHVSGIIGALGNNIYGVCGVCWRVQLMACKFIDADGNGAISDAVTCMDYARSKGAKIINASWGSYDFTSAALQDAVNSMRDAGVIFVAASGNSAGDNDAVSLFPASYNYDNVISVAATDRTDALAPFSNYGVTKVHLAAPGSPVFSCWNGSDCDYRYYDGTSMAAPQVAGTCALIWARFPGLTSHQVIRRVVQGIDPLPCLAGKCVSGGRLNLAKALGPQGVIQSEPSTVWVDDAVPDGGVTYPDGGDSWTSEPWTWVTNNPAPFSGAVAHQSDLVSGIHEHHFEYASQTLDVLVGDTLFTYAYLDPDNPPREIMLEWNDGCSEHRAFWGENLISWGVYGTSNCRPMGDLPPTGQWVRLEVPASAVELEGAVLKGLRFLLYDGRVTWDLTGRAVSGPPGS